MQKIQFILSYGENILQENTIKKLNKATQGK